MCAAAAPLRLSGAEPGAGVRPLHVVLGEAGGGRGTCPARACALTFQLPARAPALLEHLFSEHHLVIADVERVALLADYLTFWKERFTDKDFPEYCTTMLVDTKDEDDNVAKDQKYYLLSDVLPLDNQLRKDLQQKRLEIILAHQKLEREDKTYERECLICRSVLKGSRSEFLTHLFEKHNLYIAKLENLIFTGDLIELLNEKLMNNVCIYCEKTFKDRVILKEHMRKKAHKRINPKNDEYDKFFISNYLEIGRNWQSYMKNVDNKKKYESGHNKVRNREDSSSDSDSNWSDWDEKDSLSIVCLFCDRTENDYSVILSHMSDDHHFNFDSYTKKLNFYEKLKVVNYIRRQIYLKRCIECDKEFSDNKDLLSHMYDEKHLLINDTTLWNRPEFYFSTYEDDSFLFFLEDTEEGDETKLPEKLTPPDDNHISQQVALSVLNNK